MGGKKLSQIAASPGTPSLTDTAVGVGSGTTDYQYTFTQIQAAVVPNTIAAAGPTGSATVAPIITYNAQGRLTAVTTATITPAIGSITGLGAGVSTALGNAAGGSGGFALVGTTPPTGSAGGDLTGSYPSPTFAWIARVSGKSVTFNNTLTFAGTDSTTMTFPATSDTVAGLGTAQSFTAAQTIAPSVANTLPLTVTLGTLTADTKGISITGTWNNSGVTFSAPLFVNMTDTNSNGSSLLFQLQRNGGNVFTVAKFGLTSLSDLNITAGNVAINTNTGVVRMGASADVFISRSAAAVVQLGAADAASPVNQSLRAQGSRAGTDSNVAGANLTVFPGTGTGTPATSSSLILQAPLNNATATTAQTQTEVIRLQGGATPILKYTANNSTGSGAALLGANSPASTLTAPYTWITVLAGDGTTCYLPIWK